MKKKLLSLFFSLTFFATSYAQISFELQSKGANEKHFVTLKGYDIKGGETYPYTFSNLSMYKIKLKFHGRAKDNISIKILDENLFEVASNFNPKNNSFMHHLAYKCGKTGRYYVRFDVIENKKNNQ
jgi:hypothetical protein